MVGIHYFGMIIGLGKFLCGLNFPAYLILLSVCKESSVEDMWRLGWAVGGVGGGECEGVL